MAVELGEAMARCDSGGETKTRPKLRSRVREQQSAGHSNRAITTGHYISGDVQERMVAAAIDMMPSPVPPRVVADREFID